MTEVSPNLRLLLEALAADASEWATPAEVAGRLGLDVEEATDALASLDEAGLILVREPEDGGPIVSPSPRGLDLVRRGFAPRPLSARDRRPAPAPGWVSAYDRPSRVLIASTAAGSVAS